MSAHIFVVEDEKPILTLLTYNLQKEGYKVSSSSNGEEALSRIKEKKPDLVLLDWMLPDLSGIKICQYLKQDEKVKNIPIIMLTAKGEDEDIVRGLTIGADDYITKPIKPKLLVSKINALLRRIKKSPPRENADKLSVGNIVIDREEYVIIKEGIKLNLPRKEFELFALLASKPGKVFKRDDILDRVWGNEVVVGGRTIDVHIRKLREKIGESRFKTVKGVGYKFVVNED